MYDLLKRITTRIEHVLPRIDEAEAERVAALEARHRDRDLVGRLRSPAGNARAHWTAHKRRLIDDLQAFSARLAPPEADLCSWMARRLERDAPVADDEWTSVRSLLHVLAATEPHGRLPRRLRRTLAGMNSGRPEQDEAPRRLAVARAERKPPSGGSAGRRPGSTHSAGNWGSTRRSSVPRRISAWSCCRNLASTTRGVWTGRSRSWTSQHPTP
ncbi:hypothetical protein IHE61_14720 [Streptomyces sp. GKU 257-1]|nr:hypothetical protein [Streptomyces sp. GKU 257-1]